jgi:hypothetical protein
MRCITLGPPSRLSAVSGASVRLSSDAQWLREGLHYAREAASSTKGGDLVSGSAPHLLEPVHVSDYRSSGRPSGSNSFGGQRSGLGGLRSAAAAGSFPNEFFMTAGQK